MKQLSLILILILSQLSVGAQIITTFAGNGTLPQGAPVGDGLPATTVAIQPLGICSDKRGNIYLTDPVRYSVRKVDTQGIITTIAGTGVSGYNGDGILATAAKLLLPDAIATDQSGNIYFSDAYRLRKIIASTGMISTIAGNGIKQYSKDTSIAANVSIGAIMDLKVFVDGTVYFIEQASPDSISVRKISPTGALITVAGRLINPTQDLLDGEGGPAINAFLPAQSLALDKVGNLYIGCDATVKKVTTDGILHTIVGDGTRGSYNGEGQARLTHIGYANSLELDSRSNLFFSDESENRLRVIYPNGQTGTHVNDGGQNRRQYSGDGGLSRNAGTNYILRMTTDINDNVYFIDFYRVRKVTPIPGLGIDQINKDFARVYPIPATSILHINFAQPFVGHLTLYNTTGQQLSEAILQQVDNYNQTLSALSAGTHFLRLTNAAGQSQCLPFAKE